MLLIVLIALIIVFLILLLHYNQHFKCGSRNNRHARVSSFSSTHMHRRGGSTAKIIEEQMERLKASHCGLRSCCALYTVDDEEFDFFPISFLFYLIFLLLLYILIIIAQVIQYDDPTNNETVIDLLLAYSLTSYHNNALSAIHHFNVAHIIDYTLIYSVLILALWSSLFSFYRYYTTFISATTFKSVSTKTLFSKYSIYAIVFSIMFMLQIHLYYYLFPINIVLYCSFKFYCAYKFSDLLVTQCKVFLNIGLESNEDVLQSVMFSKNISLICSVLQSLNLCLFLIIYNVSIIYYLPILFSISSFILSLNFVRNRNFLIHKYLSLKQQCKCICYKTVEVQLSKRSDCVQKPVTVKIDVEQIKTMIDEDFVASKPSIFGKSISKSADYEYPEDDKLQALNLKPTRSLPLENEKTNVNVNTFNSRIIPKIKARASLLKTPRTHKALELLGIPTPTLMATPVSLTTQSARLYTPSNALTPRLNFRLSTETLLQQPYTGKQKTSESPSSSKEPPDPSPFEIPISVLEPWPNNTGNDIGNRPVSEDPDVSIQIDDLRYFPTKMSNTPRESETMMVSLNTLANYGFCSRKSVRSLEQLTKYQSTINAQTVDFSRTELDNGV